MSTPSRFTRLLTAPSTVLPCATGLSLAIAGWALEVEPKFVMLCGLFGFAAAGVSLGAHRLFGSDSDLPIDRLRADVFKGLDVMAQAGRSPTPAERTAVPSDSPP